MSAFWQEVGRQLRHPVGLRGRLIGRCMALANRMPNRLAIDALQIARHDSVLELGFGPGWAVRQIDRLASAGKIFGIDHSAEMLSQALFRNCRAIAEGRIALRQGDFGALPFVDGSFDKILAVNVAYFFGPDGDEFREARRVLRPGGLMALYVSDKSTLSRWAFAHAETHRSYTIEELVAVVRCGGFAMHEISVTAVMLPFGISGNILTLEKRHDTRIRGGSAYTAADCCIACNARSR